MLDNHIVIFCTAPDRESGETIAKALVDERLAACVNVMPGLLSTYRWQGKVEQATECLLIIKTIDARLELLKQRIKSLHPYELPEIVALPIIGGSDEYLNWISESLK